LNTKVLQCSVATRLRCDWIFNDQFVRQSLLSLMVKKLENWSTFAEVMGKNQLFYFWLTGYVPSQKIKIQP